MIDYATFQRIQHLHRVEQLTAAQIALAMAMDARTVRRWLDEPQFRARATPARPSKLDPYKAYIRRLLEHHPYSAAQILNRLREAGYVGGATIVKDYLQQVRPVRAPAFLTLHFAPGECAQVDWGHYGSVPVGNTRRRLSFFVMVLCYSRLMYVEFTVSQTMEHFLGCHVNAFEAFAGRVPAKIMVDNLKSAVLQRSIGQAPVFNPRYADFARHHRFEIAPCNVRAGHEKGRVEAGVGYVKKNFLADSTSPTSARSAQTRPATLPPTATAHPRRTRLSPHRQNRRRPAVPDHQPTIRTRLNCDHHQSRVQALARDLQPRCDSDLRRPRPPAPPCRDGHC